MHESCDTSELQSQREARGSLARCSRDRKKDEHIGL